MNKRPLGAAAVTLATALALTKLAGLTPSVQAPGGGDAAGIPDSTPPAMERQPSPSSPRPSQEASVELSTPSERPAPVRAAIAAYAASLDLPIDAVTLLSAEPVTWPDGSLGCPEPGMQYIQVLTEGFRVRLEAQGQRAEFHTDRGSQVLHCALEPGGWTPRSESDTTR